MKSRVAIFIYIAGFILLFINHLVFFQQNFVKFSTLPFINHAKLQPIYFYFIAFEFFSILIFFVKKHWVLKMYDVFFSIYFGLILFLFIYMKEISNNCISCHYVASFIFEDYKVTTFLIMVLFALYIFVRVSFKKT